MSNELDFNEICAQVLEGLKAGKPLFSKDVFFAPLLENILNAALEGEMDAHLNEKSVIGWKTTLAAVSLLKLSVP